MIDKTRKPRNHTKLVFFAVRPCSHTLSLSNTHTHAHKRTSTSPDVLVESRIIPLQPSGDTHILVDFSRTLVTSPFHHQWKLLPNTAGDFSLVLEPVLFHKNKRRTILLLFLPRQKNRFPETASKTEDRKGNRKKKHTGPPPLLLLTRSRCTGGG